MIINTINYYYYRHIISINYNNLKKSVILVKYKNYYQLNCNLIKFINNQKLLIIIIGYYFINVTLYKVSKI